MGKMKNHYWDEITRQYYLNQEARSLNESFFMGEDDEEIHESATDQPTLGGDVSDR